MENSFMDIKGLDVKSALKSMGGKSDVYLDTVKLAVRLTPGRIMRMDKMLEENNYSSFSTEIHGIKGVLEIIGAWELSRDAGWLEVNASADGNFMDLYERFKIELDTLIGSLGIIIPEEAIGEEAIDISTIKSAILEAKSAILEFDNYLALEVLSVCKKFSLEDKAKELLIKILHALTAFEYKNAMAKLNELEEMYNGYTL